MIGLLRANNEHALADKFVIEQDLRNDRSGGTNTSGGRSYNNNGFNGNSNKGTGNKRGRKKLTEEQKAENIRKAAEKAAEKSAATKAATAKRTADKIAALTPAQKKAYDEGGLKFNTLETIPKKDRVQKNGDYTAARLKRFLGALEESTPQGDNAKYNKEQKILNYKARIAKQEAYEKENKIRKGSAYWDEKRDVSEENEQLGRTGPPRGKAKGAVKPDSNSDSNTDSSTTEVPSAEPDTNGIVIDDLDDTERDIYETDGLAALNDYREGLEEDKAAEEIKAAERRARAEERAKKPAGDHTISSGQFAGQQVKDIAKSELYVAQHDTYITMGYFPA